jgi:REP-associated tyrosine transposase
VVAVAVPHHVTQRGNNRQQVFFSDAQRRFYLSLLAEQADRSRLRVLGYCLMPNHVHAIVVPMAETSMARAFGRTHNVYARHLNALRRRSGHLWQNRFYSAPLDRAHLLRALRYVDLNPVRARLIERAEDYRWSSARAHVTGADPGGLVDFDCWWEICPAGDWADELAASETPEDDWAKELRAATIAGKPLGGKEFVEKLSAASGAALEVRPRGRPRRKEMAKAAGVDN